MVEVTFIVLSLTWIITVGLVAAIILAREAVSSFRMYYSMIHVNQMEAAFVERYGRGGWIFSGGDDVQ